MVRGSRSKNEEDLKCSMKESGLNLSEWFQIRLIRVIHFVNNNNNFHIKLIGRYKQTFRCNNSNMKWKCD